MASDSSPTVFNLPPGLPFLEVMARALVADPTLDGDLSSEPVALADLTILLPTRRAVRNLADAFLRAGGGAATLLPTIRPLGDVDEDVLALGSGIDIGEGISLPPAIDAMDRQLRLARLVLAWGQGSDFGPRDPGQAAALAAELAHLIDAAETEGVDMKRVRDIVPDRFAAHWQQTLAFLDIALTYWPEELSERGLLDPAKRRNMLIRTQAAAWRDAPPAHPVIAAGSTGSIPVTADLLSTIARLPKGAVILPGLDLDLEEAGWGAVGASHPQFGMKHLLRALELERGDIRSWPGAVPSAASRARTALITEAMRPAETTDRWAQLDGNGLQLETAMQGLSLIEAPTPRQEAGALALAMREALETPERTAMLVTPDRNLARRVAEELSRWGIAIDDTAGVPLTQSVPFTFLRLICEAVQEDLAPIPLLALLKHPLSGLGLDPAECRHRARRLERRLLRGPRPAPGIEGLRQALGSADLEDDTLASLSDLLDRLDTAMKPLVQLYEEEGASLSELADAHLRTAEALAASDGSAGPNRLWRGEAGEATAQFADKLLSGADALPDINAMAYLRLLESLAEGAVVRPRFGQHPRLFILGPLEARLIDADLVLLAGLNEDTWPAEAPIDAWLSRPMRADLGLEPPERRIGLSAHDFAQAVSAPEVILSRSLKVDSAPTVPSRWLLRLDSLLKGLTGEGLRPKETWTGWADRVDAPLAPDPVLPPAPRPPVSARPRQFSATEVETLIRDPYAIYAKKVLRLRALDPIDADVSAIERGNIIHAALEAFVKKYPKVLPEAAETVLRAIGEDVFKQAPDGPGVTAFWWPRFCDIADWITGFEERIRPETKYAHAEIRGEQELTGLTRPVKLTAIADRVDERTDGTFAIYDYKTGRPPTKNEVESGLAPQLPLEAAIARQGGFTGSDGKPLKGRPVSLLSYLHLSGGDKGGEEKRIATLGDDLAEGTLAAFVDLLALYEQEATPYLSRPRVQFRNFEGRYDHLARVREWSAALDDEAAS